MLGSSEPRGLTQSAAPRNRTCPSLVVVSGDKRAFRAYFCRSELEPDQYSVSDSTTPVIVSAVRTPIGRYLGGLSSFTAPQLGAMVIREAVSRAGIEPGSVDEVIMGQVVQGGSGQAPARQALIHAGLPPSIPALTINKVCGSGLKAVMLASQAIKAGDAECIVAGG